VRTIREAKDFGVQADVWHDARDAFCWRTDVENPKQAGLGALDITVRRMLTDARIDSSIREGPILGEPNRNVFHSGARRLNVWARAWK